MSERGTGRTYRMLNMLADAIQDGQPRAMVFFATQRAVEYHSWDLLGVFNERGLGLLRLNRFAYALGDAVITMHPICRYEYVTQGHYPCDFIDHRALEVASIRTLDYIDQYSIRMNRSIPYCSR